MSLKNNIGRHLILMSMLGCLSGVFSCNKLVDAGPPTKSITNSETFRTDATANAAMAGLYAQMMYKDFNYASGATTIYAGLSSDEFSYKTASSVDAQFEQNNLLTDNYEVSNSFWYPAYQHIFFANNIIEQAASSTSDRLTSPIRQQITGESKFLRALSYFYLTNLFGDVPLVLTTDFKVNSLLPRAPQGKVYEQIEKDLTDAKNVLPDDFSISGGERVRANKTAATALLARVYLYEAKWKDAEKQATLVLNNNQYNLVSDLAHVFDKNTEEVILQFSPNFNSTSNTIQEVAQLLPIQSWVEFIINAGLRDDFLGDVDLYNSYASTAYPIVTMSNRLAHSFELNDERKNKWTSYIESPKAAPWNGDTTFYAIKYTDRPGVGVIGTQYYMVLRLAEQYLIRAEARAKQGNLNGAAEDLNKIRTRAGLPGETPAGQAAMLTAIEHERQIELFGEFGHRWLDLKRTGRAAAVLGAIPGKSSFKTYQLLYPLPRQEVLTDPNLVQNTGYN